VTAADRLAELRARPVLGAAEVAELGAVSLSMVRSAIRAGDLPVHRLGRRVLVPTDAALVWLGANHTTATVSPDDGGDRVAWFSRMVQVPAHLLERLVEDSWDLSCTDGGCSRVVASERDALRELLTGEPGRVAS
jgi:excisionase family DNA binding protein